MIGVANETHITYGLEARFMSPPPPPPPPPPPHKPPPPPNLFFYQFFNIKVYCDI